MTHRAMLCTQRGLESGPKDGKLRGHNKGRSFQSGSGWKSENSTQRIKIKIKNSFTETNHEGTCLTLRKLKQGIRSSP